MILVRRGPEPPTLANVRDIKLPALRAIKARRRIAKDDIHGYHVAAEALWKAQGYKCCYCEWPVQLRYNDVEHFRPKSSADRSPGCTDTHGYWWLAFTWENLLFSCPNCNRGGAKVDRFPLQVGSVALREEKEEQPPGGEQPLLIDPAVESGVRHIEYGPVRMGAEERWIPRSRNGSPRGDWTILVCDLARDELVDLYTDHVRVRVEPEVEGLRAAMRTRKHADVQLAHWTARLKLLSPRCPFVGLSYDALVRLLPAAELAPWGLGWEMPS